MVGMSRLYGRNRNPLFAKRWFPDDVIIRYVHWYLRFKLSYRDLAQIMGELGVCVAPCTILRWVIHTRSISPNVGVPASEPWADPGAATKLISRLAGSDVSLPRGGRTRQDGGIAFEPRTRYICRQSLLPQSAQAAWGATDHHTRRFRTDAFRVAADGHAKRVQLPMGPSRADPLVQYLNNVVEQDHRRIKSRVQPMLGFKKFYNARRVIIGIEFVNKVHKDQFQIASA
jgi:hypothetical protein